MPGAPVDSGDVFYADRTVAAPTTVAERPTDERSPARHAGGAPLRAGSTDDNADLDAFAASDAGPQRRVVLIGIDGASWAYLRPLLDAGALPSLARLVREGAAGTLRSIECHFTPPAWTNRPKS